MQTWVKELFGVEKPVIGMCHMQAMPGDPQYDAVKGMAWVYEQAHADMLALQEGGVDAILFSNEFSLPYLTKVETITVTCMASVIGELKREIKIPYGVNVLWDPRASIDLAMATGAQFVREIFTGVYASDFGLWNTNAGEVIRHQHAIGAQHVRLFFNIVPEAAAYLGNRQITDIARSTVFNDRPDALCVSGLTAGSETSAQTLKLVKDVVPDTPVFANTGVRLDNVEEQLRVADGAVIGTTFKQDGNTWNAIDLQRVRTLMNKVKELRRS
ncbi:MAG: SgcQ protein [Chloroflexi bacterium]|nr:SgcQ protein [Chloroflexota bacterium]MDL1945045.1 BtpA/SgcQ family protein [Chloroflexi bacterium CFX2]